MPTLLRLLRSLGPDGAVANAAELLEQRRREDRLVATLARRVGELPAAAPTARRARAVPAAA